MADDGEDASNAAALLFPAPPPFWQEFTVENLANYATLKQEYLEQHPELAGVKREPGAKEEQGEAKSDLKGGTEPIRLPDIPPELVNLQPPAEPEDGRWRLYGEPQTLHDDLQSLEGAGIERLGPPTIVNEDGKHADLALELKRLSKSLLLNFLEWMGSMSSNPQKGPEKVQDIRTLLLNFHHILNEYRPHQAREQLIAMMQDQLDAKRKETQAIRGVVDKAKRMMEGLGSMDVPPPAEANGHDEARRRPGAPSYQGDYWDREACAWAACDAEFA